jgi:hypothetical protein
MIDDEIDEELLCNNLQMHSGIFFEASIYGKTNHAVSTCLKIEPDNVPHFLAHISEIIHEYFKEIKSNDKKIDLQQLTHEFIKKQKTSLKDVESEI